jgi:hypothetical protein
MLVQVETFIRKPIEIVSAFAGDPSNAPLWYVNIKEAVWKTEPPLRIGSQVAFLAHFLGRRLSYTYEIKAFSPGKSLVMATVQGPFPMQTTYTWEKVDGGTRMTLANQGEPSGFAKITAGLMALAMKRAMTKDLQKLKAMLELVEK